MSANTSKGRVLIVDDDESIRDFLYTILEQAGYDVTATSDGRGALVYMRHMPVDLVLLDLMMPELDGWSVAQAIQADPQLFSIPIIVFSALGDQAPPGVAAALLKPTSLDDVLSTVARVLAGERRRSPRYAARFGLSATGNGLRTTTRDVSSGGISFAMPLPASVGDRLCLTIEWAANGAAEVEVEVRHVAAVDGVWSVGVRFLAFIGNAVGWQAELARLASTTR